MRRSVLQAWVNLISMVGFTVSAGLADAQTMTTDTPVAAVSFDLHTAGENVTYLNDLTGWNGTNAGEINVKNDLTTFGDGLCGEFDMCAFKDPACSKAKACNQDYRDCLDKQKQKPSMHCKLTRNLYIIHFVDWAADENGKISLTKSKWALYQSDGQGNYKFIAPDGNSFPDIWDVDSGVLLSVSRLSIHRDNGGNIIDSNKLPPPDIQYTFTNTAKKPLWLAGLETLISGITGPAFDPNAKFAGTPSPYVTRIRIMAISSQKLSRPVDIALAANATGTGKGSGDCSNLTSFAKCTFSNDFTVAARDFIAFGINIVPHGPAEATYTAGSTSPSITRHNEFYAVVDFTPFPRKYPMTKYPYIQGGLPVSGAATHLPYVGAACPIPIPWLRQHFSLSAFAGTVFMQQQGPSGARDRAVKLLWGFEVPIASFTGAMKQATGK